MCGPWKANQREANLQSLYLFPDKHVMELNVWIERKDWEKAGRQVLWKGGRSMTITEIKLDADLETVEKRSMGEEDEVRTEEGDRMRGHE